MSSVVIAGDTSGSITIAAPAIAGSNTLTLPAATGTVIYSNGSDNLQINSGYGSLATAYGCRAWVNFNGNGTVAVIASGNVSSITDGGVGVYTINFATALADNKYSIVSSASNNAATVNVAMTTAAGASKSTTSSLITTFSTTPIAVDPFEVNVAVFR